MNKDALKIILPLAAFLVIVQSIVILDLFGAKKPKQSQIMPMQEERVVAPVMQKRMTLKLAGPSVMEVGKKYEVLLVASATEPVSLISLETYVNFPKDAVNVTNLVSSSALDKPSFSTISQTKGVIVSNLFLGKPVEFDLGKGDVLVQKFTVSPTKKGSLVLSLDKGDGKTLLVSSESSSIVEYLTVDLNVNVAK